MSLLLSVIFWVLYKGLVGLSFLFVSENLKEYISRKTAYHISRSTLTEDDSPTITICFNHEKDLKYGTHFSIEWITLTNFGYTSSHSPLILGENNITITWSNHTHRLVLKRRTVFGVLTKCIKISPINYLEYYWVKIKFVDVKAPPDATIYFTSEENVYGATVQRWLNGKVVPNTLQKDKLHEINVAAKEFLHLPNLCQQQSFNQCLALKFISNTTCAGTKCSPYTLPTDPRYEDLPICNQTETSCQRDIYWELLYDHTTCKGDYAKS